MIYLLLIIGLVLIYFSLKHDNDNHHSKNNNFSGILQAKVDNKDIADIREELKYLSDRVENIESSLLLFEKYLNYNNLSEKVIDAEEIENSTELKPLETESQVNEKATLNDTLYQMYDEGRSIDEISSITRIGKGEILLRLGLRKQKK